MLLLAAVSIESRRLVSDMTIDFQATVCHFEADNHRSVIRVDRGTGRIVRKEDKVIG